MNISLQDKKVIMRRLRGFSNWPTLCVEFDNNPTKQAYAAAVLHKLGITLQEKHFSRGSTVTKDALIDVANVLGLQQSNLLKQGRAKAIISRLKIRGGSGAKPLFSKGGTVTKEFWKRVEAIIP